MESMTVRQKDRAQAMASLVGRLRKTITVEAAGPEGRWAVTGLLEDARGFHAVWVSKGDKIIGIGFVSRLGAIRSIRSRGKTLYDNRFRVKGVYGPKSREEVDELRTKSFGRAIAEALKEPQIGGNPVVLGWKSPTAYLRKTGEEGRQARASGSSSN